MDVKVRKKYLKRGRVGDEPIRFHASQPKGVGTTVHATITMHPVLRKHADLRKALVKHEMDEIKHWGQGGLGSHHHAKDREPELTRHMSGVEGFWKEIKRRQKHG